MALVLADRVQETSTTTGTGTLTLDGASSGYQTFSASIGNGNTCYYTIQSDTGAWEVGIGTVGAGTLARTTLISSSTGSAISFSGTLTVFVTYPAEKAVYSDGTTIVAPAGALLPVTSGGTGAATAAGARTALGLGTIATQAANSVAITGGAIDGTTVGATTVAAGSFSTLNSSGATRLGGLSGNQSLQVNNVASAVNYIQITGGATGGGTVISSQGTDTNIPIDYRVKASGYHAFTTDSGNAGQFLITHTASAVNQARITGSPTGSAVTISTQGSDTNIAFAITTKNAGGIQFRSGSGLQAFVSDTASAVNYLNFTGAATGAAPTISAAGSDSNINLTFTPKGTGVVTTTSITLSNTLTTAAYTETITASGTVGASATLAITAGTVLTATLTSATACTFTMPTATAGKSFTLLLKQPAAGTPTTATFTGVKWNSGGAPTITATLGRLDILAFVADGTNWYGTASQGYTY
jgi:hypothetical protein